MLSKASLSAGASRRTITQMRKVSNVLTQETDTVGRGRLRRLNRVQSHPSCMARRQWMVWGLKSRNPPSAAAWTRETDRVGREMSNKLEWEETNPASDSSRKSPWDGRWTIGYAKPCPCPCAPQNYNTGMMHLGSEPSHVLGIIRLGGAQRTVGRRPKDAPLGMPTPQMSTELGHGLTPQF